MWPLLVRQSSHLGFSFQQGHMTHRHTLFSVQCPVSSVQSHHMHRLTRPVNVWSVIQHQRQVVRDAWTVESLLHACSSGLPMSRIRCIHSTTVIRAIFFSVACTSASSWKTAPGPQQKGIMKSLDSIVPVMETHHRYPPPSYGVIMALQIDM